MIGSKYIKEAGIAMIPTNCQNWLALGACVYADMSVSKAFTHAWIGELHKRS